MPSRSAATWERPPPLPDGHYVSGRVYHDEQIFAEEREHIFRKVWHFVCHESEVAEAFDFRTVERADVPLIVIRGEDGRIRTFINVCSHRGARVAMEPGGNARTFTCFYHHWTYDTEGSCVSMPRPEGYDHTPIRKEDMGLREVKTDVKWGFVFVNLDPDAASLDDCAPGMASDLAALVPRLDELEPAESFAFESAQGAEWRANWKVVVDNYLECYHCTKAHPALCDLMVMKGYEHIVREQWSRQLAHASRTENSAYAFSPDDDVQIAAYWYLWPTTSIWLVPGSANLYVLAMMPSGHKTTLFSGHRYSVGSGRDEARSEYLNAVLGPEDQGLCESVQRGLKSRSYDQGRFMTDPERSGTAEHGVHRFHRLVVDALSEAA